MLIKYDTHLLHRRWPRPPAPRGARALFYSYKRTRNELNLFASMHTFRKVCRREASKRVLESKNTRVNFGRLSVSLNHGAGSCPQRGARVRDGARLEHRGATDARRPCPALRLALLRGGRGRGGLGPRQANSPLLGDSLNAHMIRKGVCTCVYVGAVLL